MVETPRDGDGANGDSTPEGTVTISKRNPPKAKDNTDDLRGDIAGKATQAPERATPRKTRKTSAPPHPSTILMA